jgi:hypothetical protein
MASDVAAGGRFFKKDSDSNAIGFNYETVHYFPECDAGQKVSDVDALVSFASEPGSNEVPGDGPVLNRRGGNRATRRTGFVRFGTGAITVRNNQPDDFPDVFEIDGVNYAVKRIEMRNSLWTKVRVVQKEHLRIRNIERVG